MIGNPLNWSAEPFLRLYAALGLALVAATFWLRSRIGNARPTYQRLNETELAYLAGGASRVGDVALLCLMSDNGAVVEGKRHHITVTDPSPLAKMFRPLPSMSFDAAMTRTAFQRAVEPLVAQARDRLRALGLSPSDAEASSFRMSILPLYALLAAFGLAKVYVGAGRGHPVGILIGFLFATGVAALICSARPARTRAGVEALRRQRDANERAARAPRDNELMVAVALTGAVVLSGTAYASVYDAWRTMGSDGGGGGDSGGGCGGGGGGCGGCS